MTIKGRVKNIFLIILFLVGALILIYPIISRSYYDYRGNEEVEDYHQSLSKIQDDEKLERLMLAYAYNNALLTNDRKPISIAYI